MWLAAIWLFLGYACAEFGILYVFIKGYNAIKAEERLWKRNSRLSAGEKMLNSWLEGIVFSIWTLSFFVSQIFMIMLPALME